MSAPVILASASAVRARILADAGVPHTVRPAAVDEAALRASLRAENADAANAATTLAELKATQVSQSEPGALVIGADQILDCGGAWFEKPADRETAATTLRALRGRAHVLATGVAVAHGAGVVWRHSERSTMTMRNFSDDFIATYLDEIGDAATLSVGAYQLEGRGAQLFSRTEADFFAILGLPLLPLLDFLRGHGVVPA